MSKGITVKVTRHAGRKFLSMYFDDPTTGRRQWRSTKATHMREAMKKAGEWERSLNSGEHLRKVRNPTWDEFRQLFEEGPMTLLATKSQRATNTALNWVERAIAPRMLSSVNFKTLEAMVFTMRAGGTLQTWLKDGKEVTKPAKPLSETSIAAVLRSLRPALAWAVESDYLPAVPKFPKVKIQRGEKHMRGRPITAEEFDRMLAAVPKVRPHDAKLWEFYLRGLWLSGLRLEESTRVSWDADEAFAIDLSGKFPRFRIYADAQKSRKDQFLPLTPDFGEFLLAVPTGDRHGPLFRMADGPAGKRMTPEHVGRIVSRIGEKAGVVVDKSKDKFATAHDLRRSFGTRWAPKVMPAVLQQLMRHSSIETTMRYYVGLRADDVVAGLWETSSGKGVVTSVGSSPKTDCQEMQNAGFPGVF